MSEKTSTNGCCGGPYALRDSYFGTQVVDSLDRQFAHLADLYLEKARLEKELLDAEHTYWKQQLPDQSTTISELFLGFRDTGPGTWVRSTRPVRTVMTAPPPGLAWIGNDFVTRLEALRQEIEGTINSALETAPNCACDARAKLLFAADQMARDSCDIEFYAGVMVECAQFIMSTSCVPRAVTPDNSSI